MRRLQATKRWWDGVDTMRLLGVIAWLGALALFAFRLLGSAQAIDSGITTRVGPDGWSVADVRVGSVAWLLGVEPGDAYLPWPDGAGGQVTTPEGDLSLGDTVPPLEWWPVGAAIVGLAVARGFQSWLPTLTSVVLVGVASFLAWELLGVVVMPLALAVIVVPTLVLGIQGLMGSLARQARLALVVGLLAVVFVEVGALASATPGTWRGIWAAASLGPALAAVVVSVMLWAIAVRRAMATHGATPGSITVAMVANTAAGRTALWGASERSRDDRAHWIHDAVLPQLATGIRDIESGHEAAGAATLRQLAEGLREDLEEDQLTVLRVGGLPAAVADALDAAREDGFECDLSVDAEGAPPPWPVMVAVWRVAQEAIGNARRHSGGDRISVAARVRHDHVVLDVSDDGVGLVGADLSRRPGHLGMQSMTDTARAARASLRFVPRSPSGLMVRFEWQR